MYNDLELDVIIFMCQIAFSRTGVNRKGIPNPVSPRWLDVKSEFLRLFFHVFFSFVIYNQCNYIHTVPNIIL